MNIHPLAVVSPKAEIGPDVRIGPFAVVEDEVVIGEGCQIFAHATIKNGVQMGARNVVGEGTVIGGLPQSVRCPADIGGVQIGANNTFREHITIHRALKTGTFTTIADGCYMMATSHVAHDCHVGNNIIMANGCMLGGHVSVDDRAFVSGGVAVHQFCRIGRMAMIGGHARVVRDVPPFVTIDGMSGDVVGLNLVGLKRNGFTQQQIDVLKSAYRLIYRSGLPWREMQDRLRQEFADGPAAPLSDFFQAGSRGFSQERRPPKTVTLKIRKEADDLETPAAPAVAQAPAPQHVVAETATETAPVVAVPFVAEAAAETATPLAVAFVANSHAADEHETSSIPIPTQTRALTLPPTFGLIARAG